MKTARHQIVYREREILPSPASSRLGKGGPDVSRFQALDIYLTVPRWGEPGPGETIKFRGGGGLSDRDDPDVYPWTSLVTQKPPSFPTNSSQARKFWHGALENFLWFS